MQSLRLAATLVFLMAVFLMAMAGCRAHVVKISLTNTSAEPIKTIIVDYPSATFGKDTLAPRETYFSLVKPVDKGPITVRFTDAQGVSHTYKSVSLEQGDDGWVSIKLTQTSADTGFDLTRSKK